MLFFKIGDLDRSGRSRLQIVVSVFADLTITALSETEKKLSSSHTLKESSNHVSVHDRFQVKFIKLRAAIFCCRSSFYRFRINSQFLLGLFRRFSVRSAVGCVLLHAHFLIRLNHHGEQRSEVDHGRRSESSKECPKARVDATGGTRKQ